jgi:hypothetical protein
MFHGLDRPTAAPKYIKDSDVDKHMNYLKAVNLRDEHRPFLLHNNFIHKDLSYYLVLKEHQCENDVIQIFV